jgi:hypothetical protein
VRAGSFFAISASCCTMKPPLTFAAAPPHAPRRHR